MEDSSKLRSAALEVVSCASLNLVQKLGSGKSADVFLVSLVGDESLDFALKVYNDDAFDGKSLKPDALQQSQEEIRHWSALNDPRVVILHAHWAGPLSLLNNFDDLVALGHENPICWLDSDLVRPSFLLELCTASLGQEIRVRCDRDQWFAPEQAIVYALHVCAATQHLHETRRVHGDIRPPNLLLGPESAASRMLEISACPGADADKALLKLGDMGVAAVVSSRGGLLQTHAYSRHVAPWFKTKPFASDAFSIAWVLLDMLSLTNDTDADTKLMHDDFESVRC
jgi:serine/threonine protein kinase